MALLFFSSVLLVLPVILEGKAVQRSRAENFFISIWEDQNRFKNEHGYTSALDVDQHLKYDGIEYRWTKGAADECSYFITSDIKYGIVDYINFTSTEPPTDVYWSCGALEVCTHLNCTSIFMYILAGMGIVVVIAIRCAMRYACVKLCSCN